MPRARPPYSPEFREQMVALVRAGRSPEELSSLELAAGRPSKALWRRLDQCLRVR
jgi:transposase-like protein